jgi:hypothetical protein
LCLAGAVAAQAQLPKITVLDFYGLRKLSPDRVSRELKISEGAILPASKGALEEKLDQVSNVVASHVEAVCCEGDGVILFVGVSERGAPQFSVRSEPAGEFELPAEVVDAYNEFTIAAARANRDSGAREDIRAGHALMADPVARVIQERFVGLAQLHIKDIRNVLREAEAEEQRAIAAYVIGYYPTKRLVVDDLQYALQDPAPSVRANAIRALGPIAALGMRDADLGIRVPATWFVEMMNSVVWSDRTKAVEVLLNLTDERHASTLDLIRERALESLIEMARWHSLRHAVGPYTLLGRIAGLSDDQIQQSWNQGRREQVITQFLKDARKKDQPSAR